MLKLQAKKLHPNAILPTKAYPKEAGWDLYTLHDVRLVSGVISEIHTGLAIKIPDGYCALIQDRSGRAKLGWKKNGGVIDCSYTGEWIVLMTTLKHQPNSFTTVDISAGTKIAQFLVLPVPETEIVEVDELPVTDRGEKGFGSSG